MVEVFIFLLGLAAGSFINAVVYRLYKGKSAFVGRSFCPHCKNTLKAVDLVPVLSFLLVRGLCRYCGKPISWQYPIVELFTGFVFLFSYWRVQVIFLGSPDILFQWLAIAVFSVFLIIIFLYDLKHYLILDKVIIPGVIAAIIFNIFLGFVWWELLLAAGAAGGFFAAQYYLSGGKWIGGGDIRFGVLMGLMLSWPVILVAVFISYILGSIVGIGLLISGKKSMGSRVPFGTFLTVGTYIALLYGTDIMNWYLALANL